MIDIQEATLIPKEKEKEKEKEKKIFNHHPTIMEFHLNLNVRI